jgi:hypothetical protein
LPSRNCYRVRGLEPLLVAVWFDASGAAAIQENKLSIGVPQHDEYGKWAVSVERAGYFNRRLDAKLHALAEEFGGIYDGDVDISR